MSNWHLPHVDEADTAGWESRIRGLAAAQREFAAQARRLARSEHRAAQRLRDDSHQRAHRTADAERAQLKRAVTEAQGAARATALRRFADLADGLAGVDYSAGAWYSPEFIGVAPPTCVRVGSFEVRGTRSASGSVPVAVPLLPTAGWAISAVRESATDLILGTVLRVVAATPPYRVRVDSFDPCLTGALGAFGALHAHTGEIVAASMTGPEALAGCLADLVDTASRRGARLTELGCRTFTELTAASGPVLEPYRLLVLLDYPSGIDEGLQRELLRVAKSAPERGVCLLVHHDQDVLPERGVEPLDLVQLLRGFTVRGEAWAVSGLERIAVRRDPAPEPELCGAVSDLIGAAAARDGLPKVELARVLPPRTDRLARVGTGRAAELRVNIGADGRLPAAVRLRGSDPPMPNMLVGGAVGQVKSNLLHVLVHGLAARYSPDDLEMYLLDFKQGLEFSVLGPGQDRPHWLPHVRVLGVYADREFGLDVLRHIEKELVARSALFKRLRNIADLAALSPDNPERPPRILLVLDEFQVMLADDDDIAEEAAALLEKLVRLGRAFGLHVVLATQSLEGIPRLAAKRDSIFGQVPYRLVLKTTPADSQAMLQTHNAAAAGLRFRGQAILNDNFGSLDANRQIQVAYAEPGELDQLRRELWQRAAARPPRVFELDEAADFRRVFSAARDTLTAEGETLPGWLGLPVGVEERPVTFQLRPEPGAGLLVLGDDALAALGVLSGVALSVAWAGRGRGDRFVLIDLLPGEPETGAGRDAVVAALGAFGHTVEVVDRARVPGMLYELREAVRDRTGSEPPVHVFLLGMHRAVRLAVPVGEEFESPADALREIAADGASVGIYAYGWWNRLKACRDHLGYEPPIGTYLFLRHPADGVKEVCGSYVRWVSRPHRGLVHDGMCAEPRQVVTFRPIALPEVRQLTGGAE